MFLDLRRRSDERPFAKVLCAVTGREETGKPVRQKPNPALLPHL
jgi:hypothetical protein